MCAGSVPHNQTCIMVNMSADPEAMMPGQLVGKSRTDMRTSPIILEQTCPLIQCNSTQHSC